MKIFDISPIASSRAIKALEPGECDIIVLRLDPSATLTPEGEESIKEAVASHPEAIVYGDYLKDGLTIHTAEADCCDVRSDFDLGLIVAMSTALWHKALAGLEEEYQYAGWYSLRLLIGAKHRLPLVLSTIAGESEQKVGERQFDYVARDNAAKERDMERAFTAYLRRSGALLEGEPIHLDVGRGEFPVEASVIIPVRNRVSTVADAIESALSQQLDGDFNVIVVDNHSTDGTTELIRERFGSNPRLVHIVPEATDLGIGGCWNLGVQSAHCGRFAVQLDSDDVYSSPGTLQAVVDKFRSEGAAMVVGSYMLTDFDLKPLPPGVIDHREWTASNGRNNLLRVNGIGAPRAFYTPIIRRLGFPNSSYGEDYAVALRISRSYHVGRIYDVLYYCRRWAGNSDHALSPDKVLANNNYKDSLRAAELAARKRMKIAGFIDRQLADWPQADERYRALNDVKVKWLTYKGNPIKVQYNPARAVSTAAAIDPASITARPCFLCEANRPPEQKSVSVKQGQYSLCVNPFPIYTEHFTIISNSHEPQQLTPEAVREVAQQLAHELGRRYVVFYNGDGAGASAPDHLHLQAVARHELPLLAAEPAIPYAAEVPEGMPFNAYCFIDELTDTTVYITVPRPRPRPRCYGNDGFVISPGGADLAGVIICPRLEDFNSLDDTSLKEIIDDVTL